ncbi:hypothetical protein [Polymorphospora rubra]|uniref:Secreted protein/lipoprotein n=1 Tax=Polymorphospora rubra TaxID=338584 RepID=A0A810MXP4_9ACTN|nr:hypothetical protein [Polymorphospora rubra]BCJ65264.1 hypothetical protein Prubr_22850 [Polymorphospora rubra]
MRRPYPGRPTVGLIAVVAIVALTSCAPGNESGDTSESGNRAAAAPSTDPRKEEASESALAAYAGYLAASRAAESVPDYQHPDLRKYLADPLLTRVRLAIRDVKDHGAMRTGSLVSDPTVTFVDLDAVPATVSIQDCLDGTDYKLVYAKTRKEVPGTASGRYVATATATLYPDGRWLISAGASHADQPC